ncbi:MAG TPA: choice-of-anchor J domain-containing protein [Candidatus Thermoplasmatota archaeon]|nr:choice-of-anchor J domain-containing protein [Candidatus Thermoplasmatota archaeon]
MKIDKKNIGKAVIVCCIAFALILPASAMTTNTRTISGKEFTYNFGTMDRDIVFSDSFETYEDFIVDDFPPWTTFDGEGGQTWGMEGVDWPNEYYTGSYMIFNPTQTTPPLDNTFDAHTGVKYISCWDTVTAMAPNDDWLFTPQLSATTYDSVSLWARSLDDQYGLEDFEIGVSTTDTDPTSFAVLQVNNDVPVAWTQYTLDISSYSGQSIYIGIHVFSYDVYAFFMDDFEVTGTGGSEDTIPPVTSCTLEGTLDGDIYTSDVMVTLSATDAQSGVNNTAYKLDGGAWTEYSEPFVVTEDGSHTVLFYSVDNAGNAETEKSSTFTIQHALPVEITIKGGFGVSATIKNVGTTDLTNVDWTITLDGSLIFVGKTKSGTIASLAAGESVTVKDIVVGFGKTGITAAVGLTETTASGTVLLFFVIGVA